MIGAHRRQKQQNMTDHFYFLVILYGSVSRDILCLDRMAETVHTPSPTTSAHIFSTDSRDLKFVLSPYFSS